MGKKRPWRIVASIRIDKDGKSMGQVLQNQLFLGNRHVLFFGHISVKPDFKGRFPPCKNKIDSGFKTLIRAAITGADIVPVYLLIQSGTMNPQHFRGFFPVVAGCAKRVFNGGFLGLCQNFGKGAAG